MVTLWATMQDAEALPTSDEYLRTVGEIERAGFLAGSQSVEVLELHRAVPTAFSPAARTTGFERSS